MVVVNPLNVINLLLLAFSNKNIPPSAINDADRDIASYIEQLLFQSMESIVNVKEEQTLDFEDRSANEEPVAVEESDSESEEAFRPPDPPMCSRDDENLDFDYKRRAVAYWRSGKGKNLQLHTVTSKFRKVKSATQLW